ncbi:MAG: hypothetical protein M3295_04315 [Chloroflexota bacterium]|nr:hypothetical protein [Chloroflexota bacterium]
MRVDHAAGAFLVGLPVAFNAFFFLLGRSFDYPGILRARSARSWAGSGRVGCS